MTKDELPKQRWYRIFKVLSVVFLIFSFLFAAFAYWAYMPDTAYIYTVTCEDATGIQEYRHEYYKYYDPVDDFSIYDCNYGETYIETDFIDEYEMGSLPIAAGSFILILGLAIGFVFLVKHVILYMMYDKWTLNNKS